MTVELNAYTKKTSKKKSKRTTAATESAVDASGKAPMKPGNGVLEDTPVNELASHETPVQEEEETDSESVQGLDALDSSLNSSSDDNDDPRQRTSKKDRQTVRGRILLIDVRGKTSKKLFK